MVSEVLEKIAASGTKLSVLVNCAGVSGAYHKQT